MQLEYSFNSITTLFNSGELPFPDMHTENVKVCILGLDGGAFPSIFPIGKLLTFTRADTNESGITLRVTYPAGRTPPSIEPPPIGKWTTAPNTPQLGFIWFALPVEAIKQIRKNSGDGYDYELTLHDVQFTDKTPNI